MSNRDLLKKSTIEETLNSSRIYHGSKIDLLVLSRNRIATFTSEISYIVISVTDPERAEATVAVSPFCRAILRLRFHDTAQNVDLPGWETVDLSDATVMSEADAQAIWEFVARYIGQIRLIVCQCEAGISRSAGIAAALSRILQGDDSFFFDHYLPGRPVYDLLLRTAQTYFDNPMVGSSE